uniref:Kazal-like domain-containing protein n=1 Tax=Megaselia scalaris TaxID=36166 RepID=T1GLY3_MEGSC
MVISTKMVRLTIALAICFFCVLGAMAHREIDHHTLRPGELLECDDKYQPVCVFDKEFNCYLTVQNMCHVVRLWSEYGPLSLRGETACKEDLLACDPSRYVLKPRQ